MQTSPEAALDDVGVGVYGQGILDINGHVDVTFGVRYDHEQRDASIFTGYESADCAAVDRGREPRLFGRLAAGGGDVAGAARHDHLRLRRRARSRPAASIRSRFRATKSYDEEHAWNYEGGVKTSMASGQFTASAAVFSIDWTDLQLNLPIPGAPGQFYIDNVGGATSRGVEFEVMGAPVQGPRPVRRRRHHARACSTTARSSGGIDVSGNKMPNTPAFTTTFGAQYSSEVRPAHRIYGRVDVSTIGAFEYDEANTQRQDAYTLTNFRVGLQAR